MSTNHTQEALDEYYSTGIDPSGGDIGPDFDDESEGTLMDNLDRLEDQVDARLAEIEREVKAQKAASLRKNPSLTSNLPTKTFNRRALFWIAVIVFFGICIIGGLVKDAQEKARVEQHARELEWEEYQRELQLQREVEAARNRQMSVPDVQPRSEENKTVAPVAPVKSSFPQRGTAYGDGYWDGYEEGYDDADGYQQYGFKYNESTNKYRGEAFDSYVQGYRKGYREGWRDGVEEVQYQYEMGY